MDDKYSISPSGRKSIRYKYLSPEQKSRVYANVKKYVNKNYELALYWGVKRRAKALNIPFDLEPSDIVFPVVCPVLGIPIMKGTKKSGDNSPSVDRIVPSLGYVKGNVIVVSQKANLVKNNATPDEILKVGHFYKDLEQGVVQPMALQTALPLDTGLVVY